MRTRRTHHTHLTKRPVSHFLCTLNPNRENPSNSVIDHQESESTSSLQKLNKNDPFASSLTKHQFGQKTQLSLSMYYKSKTRKPFKFFVKDGQESEPTNPSSVSVVSEEPSNEKDTQKSELSVQEVEMSKESGSEEKKKQQEMDWKTDEEFKKFMGNPSIEAAIKLEKKRADRKLKELDRQSSDNPIVGLFNRVVRDSLTREKERLEKAEETFKALDVNNHFPL